jgi:hypothetical protein
VLGLIAVVIAITGLWNLLVRTFAARHRDNPLAQAASHAW